MKKGTSLPFDVSDQRAVEYDLKPRPLQDRVYVDQIVSNVRALMEADWQVKVPFGDQLTPLGHATHDLTIHGKAEMYATTDRWVQMLEEAETDFEACGISLNTWTRFPGMREALARKAEA